MPSCPWKNFFFKKISVNLAVDAHTSWDEKQRGFDSMSDPGPNHDLRWVLLPWDDALVEWERALAPVSVVLVIVGLLNVEPRFIAEQDFAVPSTTKSLQQAKKSNATKNQKLTEGIFQRVFEFCLLLPNFARWLLFETSSQGLCEECCAPMRSTCPKLLPSCVLNFFDCSDFAGFFL
jgi:hypothetical protein